MKYNIRGEKIEITPAIKSYIEEKIGKLEKYFENTDEMTANVVVKVRGNDQKIEIIIISVKNMKRLGYRNNQLKNHCRNSHVCNQQN